MTEKSINPYFDPDVIIITKDILRKFINALIKRWKKTQGHTFFGVKGLEGFRLSLRFQSDEEVQETMSSIIKFVNEMQLINSMMVLRGDMPKAEVLADMAIKKIESGDLFDD